MSHLLDHLSLGGKVNRDQHFGKDQNVKLTKKLLFF